MIGDGKHMLTNEKLKQLRQKRKLTQEEVAEYLGVSAQTVSKWERGLLSPDIRYLPRLAVLYHTSIDAMFNMESCWDEEHRKNFLEKINALHQKRDTEGVYQAWIAEIELKPDRFADYITVMIYVLQNGLFDDTHIKRLLQLADYAERYCVEDDIRNEIHRVMLQICSHASNPELRQKSIDFYHKLPMLAHSREFFFDVVCDSPEERDIQIKKNLMRILGLVDHCIRRLVRTDMPYEEKLYYHKTAVAVLEAVLDGKYGGFYDVSLLYNYYSIVSMLCCQGNTEEANLYFEKLQTAFLKHFCQIKQESSAFVADPEKERDKTNSNLKRLLHYMLTKEEFSAYRQQITALQQSFLAHIHEDEEQS